MGCLSSCSPRSFWSRLLGLRISTEPGPRGILPYPIDYSCTITAWVGSQSAPIGTPPRTQICKTAQYLEPVYAWGPASVLKHMKARARKTIPVAGSCRSLDWSPFTCAPELAQEDVRHLRQKLGARHQPCGRPVSRLLAARARR